MADLNCDVIINWDKEKFSSDELDVVEKQGMLFSSCQNEFDVDAFDFIKKFMQTQLAEDISVFSATSIKQIGEHLLNMVDVMPLTEKKYTEALYWIGYLYRYWNYMGTPSKEIVKIAPVEKAYVLYSGYHCLDVQEAIALLIERSGKTRLG